MAILKELATEDIQLTQNNIRDLYFFYWKKRYAWEKILDEVDEDTAERLEDLLEPLYTAHHDLGMLINSAGVVPEKKDYTTLREEAEEHIVSYILKCYKEGKDICSMVWGGVVLN